jgi:hypothetical protein
LRRVVPVAALAAAAGCSQLPENSDGVATLELRLPVNVYLEQGRPVTLHAVARNRAGDSVGAVLAWRTPDTTLAVDSASGTVTANYSTGQGRVQVAVVGAKPLATSLENLIFKLTAPADTLVLTGADSLDATQDAVGAQIAGLVLQGGDPVTPAAGRPVTFVVVEPTPVDSPAVVLGTATSNRSRDSTLTDATGAAGPMTVVAALHRTPPDRVVVEAIAYRASGDLIPGSRRQFVIRFRHQ